MHLKIAEVFADSDPDARCKGSCLVAPRETGIKRTTEYSIERVDAGGAENIRLASFSNHFYFLTKVSFKETDGDGETAQCEVRKQADIWILEAKLGKNSDVWAKCSARCVIW